MKNERSIYIDMDGVVADFDKFVSNLLGRKIGWGVYDLTAEEWRKISEIDNFYYQLELIPESTTLVALCKSFSTRFNVSFLTAIPREQAMPTSRDDKTRWLNKYFPGIPINFGPFSRDKQNWCKPGDILIDDKPENVEQWVAKKGVAVHHTGDFDRTIRNILLAIDDSSPRLLT
jgi:5'(3')-deoxyribonucleotidase